MASLTAELDATGAGSIQARLDALPDEIALELGQARHDRARQLAEGVARSNDSPVWARTLTPWPCSSSRVPTRSDVERPQRLSSVTSTAPISRRLASSRTYMEPTDENASDR